MAIAAQRFKFLDGQTNVPIADVVSQKTSDLLNLAQNELKNLSESLTKLIDSNVFGPIKNVLANPSQLDPYFTKLGEVRITKDFFSSSIDLIATPASVLQSSSRLLAGTNDKLATVLNGLSRDCQNFVLGSIGGRKSMNPLVNCGTKGLKRQTNQSFLGCRLNNLANLIAAANGGVYNPTIYDKFQVENLASLLGIAGYKAGLCGILAALTLNNDNLDSIARIASNMLGSVITRGDMQSLIDIGATLVEKGTGMGILSIIPGVSDMIFTHYLQPAGLTDSQMPLLYGSMKQAMEGIDKNWNFDPESGLTSVANLGGSLAANFNDINNLLMGGVSDAVTAVENGVASAMSEASTMLAGIQFPQNDVLEMTGIPDSIAGVLFG